MPHMNTRLFPLLLAALGTVCVAVALAIARHGVAVTQYAL
jgi:hypothetical protein